MRKTYITPASKVEQAELTDGLLTVTSIAVSDESGNEEYVKEQEVGDDGWSLDW